MRLKTYLTVDNVDLGSLDEVSGRANLHGAGSDDLLNEARDGRLGGTSGGDQRRVRLLRLEISFSKQCHTLQKSEVV